MPPASDDEGQVSEASSMQGQAEEIMPDQAVAGAPAADSGETQEGKTGPNARSGNEERDDSTPPA